MEIKPSTLNGVSEIILLEAEYNGKPIESMKRIDPGTITDVVSDDGWKRFQQSMITYTFHSVNEFAITEWLRKVGRIRMNKRYNPVMDKTCYTLSAHVPDKVITELYLRFGDKMI